VTPVRSATFAKTGTYSAALSGGAAGTSTLRITKQLRTGFRYRLSVWGRDTATATCKVRVYNAETRNYLQTSGGAWSAASADVATTATTAFVKMTSNFTVESFAACGGKDRVTVYIDLVCTQNEVVYFDDFDIWPELDFVGIFGHNLDAGMAPTIRSSTDNFGAVDDLVATMTVLRPAFYKTFTTITAQYVRIVFPTVNVLGAPKIGELFGGQSLAPLAAISSEAGAYTISTNRRQIVSDYQAFTLSDLPETSLVVPAEMISTAEYDDFRNEIVGRSEGSLYPLVIVPDDTSEVALVVMGRLGNQQDYRRLPPEIRHGALIVQGLPYATVVS
jgi:hypothetical protein